MNDESTALACIQAANDRLIRDCFAEFPVYSPPRIFRRHFRMQKSLYLRIVTAIESHDSYFQQRHDATKTLRLSALQQCTAAIRQLAYSVSADVVDEYVRIDESTAVGSVLRFYGAVINLFGEEFLRAPTNATCNVFSPCMRSELKNCLVGWAGQYKGKEKKPTIILEAVASSDLWTWNAFFGMPGSNNVINVLDRIYPSWAKLVQTIHNPIDNKRKYYSKKQEAAREDRGRLKIYIQDGPSLKNLLGIGAIPTSV
ncbi:LOW QUALITY PROTEIN: hypothetical protein PHMEG_00023030 [Phytophthora megakarya]|uniref:Uncharacterized protein n=1 Tax=Phytophthora megakarya TaxID=4795 RepID=A0A225VHB1_9STRA|nr:LOW QUALITY PROTEIN: hypothetical protein PHMEG_00023030 [Phytophthora megakarya]